MSAHYHDKLLVILFIFSFSLGEAGFEVPIGNTGVNVNVTNGGNVNVTFPGAGGEAGGEGYGDAEDDWKLDISGDKELLECTLQEFDIGKIFKDKNVSDGMCSMISYGTDNTMFPGFQLPDPVKGILGILGWGLGEGEAELIGEFIGNPGSPFDLGGFAKCKMNLPEIKTSSLGNFCNDMNTNVTLSPIATMALLSVDAEGLIGGGLEGDAPKKVEERTYRSTMTGKDLFMEYKGIKGGFLISKALDDPSGSTAVAFNSFDKASIVLKTMAAKANKDDDNASSIRLPETKGASLNYEDEAVQIQMRLKADINEFTDTLARRLRKDYIDEDKIKKVIEENDKIDEELTLVQYDYVEKKLTRDFFDDNKSGLQSIYKAIESESMAKLASLELLMTADPNYIADPSEARAKLIHPSKRNAFRYAALLQQEKNKQMKLNIAEEMKRKKQYIDISKRMAQIRASIFRYDIAKQELDRLLLEADGSVTYTAAAGNGAAGGTAGGTANGGGVQEGSGYTDHGAGNGIP